MSEAQEQLVQEEQSSPSPESAPEIGSISDLTQVNRGESAEVPAAPTAAEIQLMELEKLSKFKFEGKEWTAKELRNAYLKDGDYRQKTAAVKREREAIEKEKNYYENLAYDLNHVRNNPSLASKFREIYPESFHRHLENVLGTIQSTSSQPQSSHAGLDPAFMDEFNQMKNHYKEQRQSLDQQKEAALISQLDSKFSRLQELYPLANEDEVSLRAEMLCGEKGRQGISDLEWDQLWKSSQERNEKRMETWNKRQVESQRATNLKSKDVPSGGGIPAPPVKQPRTIKEAGELARRAFEDN